jgi:hypothetical protein
MMLVLGGLLTLSMLLTVSLYFVATRYFVSPIRLLRFEIAHFLAGIQNKNRINTE